MSHRALNPEQFREQQVAAHLQGVHGYEYSGPDEDQAETVAELQQYLSKSGGTLHQFHQEVHESARKEPYIGPMRDENIEYFHGPIPPHGVEDLGGG